MAHHRFVRKKYFSEWESKIFAFDWNGEQIKIAQDVCSRPPWMSATMVHCTLILNRLIFFSPPISRGKKWTNKFLAMIWSEKKLISCAAEKKMKQIKHRSHTHTHILISIHFCIFFLWHASECMHCDLTFKSINQPDFFSLHINCILLWHCDCDLNSQCHCSLPVSCQLNIKLPARERWMEER